MKEIVTVDQIKNSLMTVPVVPLSRDPEEVEVWIKELFDWFAVVEPEWEALLKDHVSRAELKKLIDHCEACIEETQNDTEAIIKKGELNASKWIEKNKTAILIYEDFKKRLETSLLQEAENK